MDPAISAAVKTAAQSAEPLATGAGPMTSSFDVQALLQLLHQGGLTVYPLALCSIAALAIVFQQMWRTWRLESRSRTLTRDVVEALVKNDMASARSLAEAAKTPLGAIFLEGLRWRNIALEDLNGILATSRQEAVADLKRGLWILGTIGSLAPFIGLFGTVVGILKSFHDMATQGSGGFAVVAAGISEALIATAVGLGVAIVALAAYNYLQVRLTNSGGVFTRSCDRLVQALLYLESAAPAAADEH